MARIFPFRGITYNKNKIKDCSLVLTQPYDKIDEKSQNTYYRRHKYNVVRIIKGKEQKGDKADNNKYIRGAKYLNEWLKKKILVQDTKPTIYAYYQYYKIAGVTKIRRGFIALGRLVEFGKGGVHAHERTLLVPKQDRLNLMRATGGTAGQIFMLYSDPKLKINHLMDKAIKGKKPDITARDEYGAIHKVWKIQNPRFIKSISRIMDRKDIFIADGHHRYETAVNYRNEMKHQGFKCSGNESYDNRMMTFVNLVDKGLTILATHRLVFGLKGLAFPKFEKQLKKYFTIKEYPFKRKMDEKKARKNLQKDLPVFGITGHCFGLVAKGQKKYLLLTLKSKKIMNQVVKEKHSRDWKKLDVAILHSLILDKLLGVDKRKLEREQNVRYERYQDEAIKAVQTGKFQLAFLLNPTRASEMKKVAGCGEKMPQKSTDFYPKLLSGMVISKINFTGC